MNDHNDLLTECDEWSQTEICRQEKIAIGFYLSTHPLEDFQNVLEKMELKNIADYEQLFPGDKIMLAGVVSGLQIKYSKKGNRFCIFKLEDRSKSAKCLVWSEALGKYGECLKDDEVIIINGRVESNEGQDITVIVEEAGRLTDKVCEKARGVKISLPIDFCVEENLYKVIDLLSGSRGNCQVYFSFQIDPDIMVRTMNPSLRIKGSKNLDGKLSNLGIGIEWEA